MTATTNAKHSSKTAEHYTPAKYVEAAREVLGGIDLDPASCAIANETVKATEFYTKDDDGLSIRWFGNIFCNPPGGKVANKSLPKLFWNKLVKDTQEGFVDHAIFLAFSIEALQTCQKDVLAAMGNFALCIPDHRISFVDATGKPLGGNTHASAFVYIPGRVSRKTDFIYTFSQFGVILNKR